MGIFTWFGLASCRVNEECNGLVKKSPCLQALNHAANDLARACDSWTARQKEKREQKVAAKELVKEMKYLETKRGKVTHHIYWEAKEERDLLTVNNLETTFFETTSKTLVCQQGKGEICVGKTILGSGGFGTVHFGTMQTSVGGHQAIPQAVAVKCINFAKFRQVYRGSDWKEYLQYVMYTELVAMIRCMGHPNIVQLKFATCTSLEMIWGMELASKGDLWNYIFKHGPVSEERARIWFRDVASALEFCHSRGVVHLDVKAENILIDEKFHAKLTDFGLALIAEDPSDPEDYDLSGSCRGTPDYLAPEMAIKRAKDARKCDVWGLGTVLFIMLAGFHPFRRKSVNPDMALLGIINFPPDFPKGPMQVIRKAHNFNSTRRATMKDLLEDKWVKGDELNLVEHK